MPNEMYPNTDATATVKFMGSDGKDPKIIDKSAFWTSSDPNVVAVVSGDEKSVKLHAPGPLGTAHIDVKAAVDLGESPAPVQPKMPTAETNTKTKQEVPIPHDSTSVTAGLDVNVVPNPADTKQVQLSLTYSGTVTFSGPGK